MLFPLEPFHSRYFSSSSFHSGSIIVVESFSTSAIFCFYTIPTMLGDNMGDDGEEIICGFLVGTYLVIENHAHQTFYERVHSNSFPFL